MIVVFMSSIGVDVMFIHGEPTYSLYIHPIDTYIHMNESIEHYFVVINMLVSIKSSVMLQCDWQEDILMIRVHVSL